MHAEGFSKESEDYKFTWYPATKSEEGKNSSTKRDKQRDLARNNDSQPYVMGSSE